MKHVFNVNWYMFVYHYVMAVLAGGGLFSNLSALSSATNNPATTTSGSTGQCRRV